MMNSNEFVEALAHSHCLDEKEIDEKSKSGKDLLKRTLKAHNAQNAYAELVDMLEDEGEIFEDDEFPAKIESIFGTIPKAERPKWGTFCWLTPDDFFGPHSYKLFEDKIEPADIKQGALGDCYFLSCLASLAEDEKRIRKLFLSNGRQDPLKNQGCYCVEILTDGLRRPIYVDNYFPCVNKIKGPCFTRANGNELWVMVLEKAWAKVYGGYGTIEAGLTSETLHDLTGAPVKRYLTSDEGLFEDLLKAEKKNYAMTAGCESDTGVSEALYKEVGLITSHAYSLLSACVVNDASNKPINLVRLRNPWGQREWNGDWSDNSGLWTEDIKRQVRQKLGEGTCSSKNDGEFFMEFSDFIRFFGDVNIAMVDDSHVYNGQHVVLTHETQANIMYKFEVRKEGHFSFVATQPTKKKMVMNDPSYEYKPSIFALGKINMSTGKVEYIESLMGQSRDTYIYPRHLKEGMYILGVLSLLPNKGEKVSLVVGSYGPEVVELTAVPPEIKRSYTRDFIFSQIYANREEWEDYTKYGEPNIKHYKLSKPDEGQVAFYYNNQSRSVLKEEITFTDMKNCRLAPPFSGLNKISITVNPGQEVNAVLRTYPGYSYKYVRNVSVEKSIQDKVREAIAKGSKMAKKQGETEVEITGHVMKFTDGYIYVLHNKTKELTIKETVSFKLQNLRIEGNEEATTLNIECKPGEIKYVSLKRIPMTKVCSVGFGFKYAISG